MYGLPKDFDAGRFVGCTLEGVWFGEYSLQLSFDRNTLLSVESSFEHITSEGTGRGERKKLPVSDSRLMQLVGHSVESAKAVSDGTLCLHFTNGQILVVYDDSAMYEAYQIRFGDEVIIV